MASGFEDDFAKGEAAAARLAARMAEATKRFERVAETEAKDARIREKTRADAQRAARDETPAEPTTTERRGLKDNIEYQERAKRAAEERLQLERRYRGELEQTSQATRRIGTGLIPSPVAGGAGGGGKLPPRFFTQPGYPEGEPPRRLPSGRSPYELGQGRGAPQLLEKNPPHPEEQQRAYQAEARAIRERNAAAESATTASSRMRNAEGELGPSIGRTTQFQRAANLEYQRFGALSSEWIGATARGATTIQELGRQTTATIGKFGGWLAAGGLLFTALDAIKQIGHGAIESASGVNQLERVIKNRGSIDPNALQGQFRSYSQHFNLPIEDVTEAAYEMGKVFKTQDEALEASKAVLYSVKVGELDVATASRYLIAIINGFHLPAGQLVGVFDQLNNAQNEFGISISDVEAGLAKSSGAFNAATTKGSPLDKYHELLALITTAQKATGQTGQVVGTAIQRSPNFLRQQKNKDILKKFGINAGDDLNQIIVEAFKRAQSLSGHKIAELASAIFGPQYGARIGTPLFQQYDLYKKVLAKTGAGPSKGSGETELQTQLHSISEEIAKIGTELESVGSNLAEAGFFDLLGVGVTTLTSFLQVANDILETFNRLPTPLKHTLAIALELAAVIKLLRKFNLGDNFAEGSAGRRVFSGPDRQARLYQDLLVSEEKGLRQELERNNNVQLGTERRLPSAQRRVGREAAELDALTAERADETTLAAQRRSLTAAESQETSLRARQLETAEIRRDLLVQLDAVEADNAVLSAARNDATAAELARARGRQIPGSFGVGKLSAKDLARESGERLEGGGVAPLLYTVPTEAEARAAEQSAKAATGVESSTRRATPIFSRAKAAATGAAHGIEEAGRGLKGLGSSLYDLAGGPIGLLLGGLFLALEYGDDIGKALAKGQEHIDAAEEIAKGGVQSTQKTKKFVKTYEEFLGRAGTTLEEYAKAEAAGKAPAISLDGLPGYFTTGEAAAQKKLLEGQQRQLQEGEAAHFLGADAVRAQLKSLENLTPGTVHYQRALKRIREEAQYANAGEKEKKQLDKEVKLLEAKNINASADLSAFFKNYNAVADKLLLSYIQNLSQLVQGGPSFAGHKDVRRLVNASVVQGVRDLVSNKPAIRAKGEQTLSELPQALASYEQQELKASQTLAHTQSGRERAYDRYIHSLRFGLREVRSAFKGRGGEVTGKLRKTEEEIKQFEAEGKGSGGLTPKQEHNFNIHEGPADKARLKEEQQQLANLRERAKRLRRTKDELSTQQQHEERELQVLIKEQQEEQTQEHVGYLGEVGQIAAARIGNQNPVGQARATLAYANKALKYVRDRNAAPQDIRQALLAVLNARQQLEDSVRQEAQDLASANEALAQAKANGDPILEAKAELAKAQADLNLARTPAERKNALAELINAEHKLEEDRANIALARLGLEAAQTDDPVKQATIKVREADQRLRNAHGKQARLEARAARASAVREKRDAVASARIEDVEFQAAIGRITTDQEIAAYTRLLRTLKLSKQARRSLIEKIHALQEEASGTLELTVGDIQLPTIYDIRRAVQGGGGGAGNSYTDASSTEVNIHIHGGDLSAVSRTVDNVVKRNTKNSRRSAGMTK